MNEPRRGFGLLRLRSGQGSPPPRQSVARSLSRVLLECYCTCGRWDGKDRFRREHIDSLLPLCRDAPVTTAAVGGLIFFSNLSNLSHERLRVDSQSICAGQVVGQVGQNRAFGDRVERHLTQLGRGATPETSQACLLTDVTCQWLTFDNLRDGPQATCSLLPTRWTILSRHPLRGHGRGDASLPLSIRPRIPPAE